MTKNVVEFLLLKLITSEFHESIIKDYDSISELLGHFITVFEELKGLPPQRTRLSNPFKGGVTS